MADMAHFFYIHYAFPTYFKNVFEGHIATQYLNTKGRPDMGMASICCGEENLLRSEASYFGPTYMINTLLNTYKGVDVENVLINCHYPVTENSFVLQWGVIVKKLPGVSDEQANKIAGKFAKAIGVCFLQDVEIWQQDPHRQPVAVRGRRPGLPAAALVRAVLCGRRRYYR
jgi:3-ketosteroid 9alpha-monooxygenase subunit A